MAVTFESIMGTIIASVNEAAKAFDAVMRKEYERGVADGKRQASEELRARVASVLGSPQAAGSTIPPSHTETTQSIDGPSNRTATRAPRGSVEPAVMGAIAESIKGKKATEIAAETGVPENSVRGMLNKLRKDGRVFKVGEVWRPVAPITQPDGSTVSVTPDGRLISTPAESVGMRNPGAGAPGPINDPTE